MKNIAVLLASGLGSRFASDTPKQFVRLAGKPVVQYALEAFAATRGIDAIILVTRPEYIAVVDEILSACRLQKTVNVISGGVERYDSTWAALQAIADDDCNLIIHDAVRPFISQRLITECLAALLRYRAVTAAIDTTDTIVQVQGDVIQDIPDRRLLKCVQTPQAFKKSVLARAYALLMQDDHKTATDDCGVVRKYLPQEAIGMVRGEACNFKITYPQDMDLAAQWIRRAKSCPEIPGCAADVPRGN